MPGTQREHKAAQSGTEVQECLAIGIQEGNVANIHVPQHQRRKRRTKHLEIGIG